MTSDQKHLQSSLDGASWSTELQNLSFNQNGALTSQRLGSASNPTNDYSYHIEGWLAAMNDPDNLTGGRHLSASWRMAYQANGNVHSQRWRQSMNLRSSALQYNYAYNAVDFLTSAAFSGGGYSSSAYDVTELAYDLDGNFTRIRRNNQTGVGLRSHLNLSYSAGTNKISLMEDPNPIDFYNFGYDAAGNMNLASHLSLSGASYDERNLPVEFNYQVNKRNLSAHWWMGYDSGALRVYKADQLGNTTHFVRDLNGIEPAPMKIGVIASYYNGALRYHGLLGLDGSPDFIGSQADGTSRYYFLKDHPSVDGQVLGSVRTTVDFSNTALGYDPDFHRGKFYPFGIRRGGMPGRSSSTSTPDDDYPDFIGTGHTLSAHRRKRDAELDLDYSSPERSRRVLTRNYDPLIGRFMQVDPHYFNYTDMTPYAYLGNNPLIYTDPTGMDSTFYIRQTHQSANLTHQQKDEITNQAQSVFSQNGIPLKVKFINLDGKGNIQFIKLDPTDVRIDLVDDNNIVLKNGKKSGAISSEAEGISPVGSQIGLVTIDALTRKNINVTGVGNLVVHEGIHAMGLRHNNEGANIMNTELSGRQINRHQQIISIKHISFIIDTFLKRE